jgi:predicted acetyltransferase
MTALVRPDLSLHRTWAAAVAEFGDAPMHGSGIFDNDEVDLTEAGCRTLVDHLLSLDAPDAELPEGWVPCTHFWIVDGDGPGREFVGYLALRHALTPRLLEEGGHIGYSVRPSRRREGHASRALAAGLREAGCLGLERVLLTCDEDNVASRRTIEGAGGTYEDSRNGTRRYWIATSGEK